MKIRKIIFTTVLSALVCFGLCQQVQSATDTPDPGPLNPSNTADGQSALGSLTTGLYNSAFGFLSLLSNADANFNTGVGAGVLLVNTASENTAVGAGALFSNVDGSDNNAVYPVRRRPTKLSYTIGRLSHSYLLTCHRDLWQNAREEMNKRPEMRRDGTTFLPRVRGYSENISRAAARQGYLRKGQKQ